MLFYICHNAEERLKLIDKMLLSGWYQKRAGTVTMTDVKMHFSISESLFNAERECDQLLTSDGKININGLHGARRSALYLDRTYSIVCPHCRTQSPKVIESVALNRLLLFGKIEITRKEACLSKVEEFKDYLWPLRNWISTMWHQLHHLGFNQLSLFLHTLDRYVRSIEKYPQHILFVAVVMKASLIGLKKLGVKSLELPLANCTEMINNSIKVAAAIFFLRGMIEAVEEGAINFFAIITIFSLLQLSSSWWNLQNLVYLGGTIVVVHQLIQIIQNGSLIDRNERRANP